MTSPAFNWTGKDPWLTNLATAMQYNPTTGEPELRVNVGSSTIEITGPVTIPGEIEINNDTGNPIPISANTTANSALNPVYVNFTNGTIGISGSVNIGSMPEVEIKNDSGNPIPISGEVTATLADNSAVNVNAFSDGLVDAFGRLRVSNPQTLFDTQSRYYDHSQFATSVAGAGTYVYDSNSSTFAMNVSAASGDKVYAETYKVFPYQPGKSLLIYATFCMNTAKTGLRQRVGYFSSQNGIFFEVADSTLNMVIRSSSSGSIVEDRIPRNLWNGDKLDGTGPSGLVLNTALDQIFYVDIEWLGVGSVRVGFVINGQYICCHTFNHANTASTATANNTTTYMSTACLPLRYEIENTAGTSGSSTLRQICASVISEGGYSLSGTPRGIGHNLGTPVTLPNDVSFKPLISIRLKSTNPDSIVLPTFFTIAPVAQSTFKYRIYSRAVTTGGSWSSIGASSSVEYNLAPTAVSSGEIVAEGFIISSNQTAAAPSQSSFGFEVQLQRQPFTGVMYEYVLTAATTGNGQTVYASIEWQEVN